MHGLNIKVI